MQYDSRYVTWKGWLPGGLFGQLSDADRRTFAAEIAKCRLGSIHAVLEIGFGNGQFMAYAKERGWSICGVEVNAELLTAARAEGYDVCSSGDMENLAPGSFDLIVAFDVLEHLNPSQISQLLEVVRRLLRLGGTFLARFPNGDSPFGLPNQNGDVTHVTAIGGAMVDYFSQLHGLEVVFKGAEYIDYLQGSTQRPIRQLLRRGMRSLLARGIRFLFFPTSSIEFMSANLVVALRKSS